MQGKIFSKLIVSAGLVAAFYSPVLAQPQVLYYIVDSSGSMWGRAEGETKISIAKTALNKLIAETPADVLSAVAAYGHRKKADCSDIEELIPLGPIDKAAAAKKIGMLIPKGKTPLTDSLEFAAGRIQGQPLDATIVLVSDGIETCGKDPCAAAKALKEKGLKFKLHVVGFGVGDESKQQLACIAQAGGGLYFKASNSAELISALTAVKTSVAERKEIPVPAPEPTATAQKLTASAASVRVKAQGPARVRLVLPPWAKKPYYWKLTDAETGEERAKFNELGEQIVSPGEYQLVWRQTEHASSDVVLSEVVGARPGQVVELKLVTGINLVMADWARKQVYFWALQDLETGEHIARFKGEISPELAPAGRYKLVFHETEHGHTDSDLGEIEIKEGMVAEVSLNTGIKLISPPDLKPPYQVKFAELGADGTETGRIVRMNQSFGPIVLKPAAYKIIYQQTEHGSAPVVIVDKLDLAPGVLAEVEL